MELPSRQGNNPPIITEEALNCDAKMAKLTIDFSCEGERLKVRTSEGGAFDHYEYLDFSAGEVTKLCREFIGLLNKATRRGRLDPSLRVQLQSLGQDLYDNLLPLSVKERLHHKGEPDLVLHIEDRLVHIPWELLFDGEQFLCRRFNLGRIVTTRQSASHFQQRTCDPPLSMLLLYDPKGDLPAAHQEGMLIRNTLDLYVDRVDVSSKTRNIRTDYIRRSIRNFDIVHYAGHATYDTEDPSQSGWLVKEGTVTAALLVKMKGIRPLPSLVFSNACQSSEVGEWKVDEHSEETIFGLANAFLAAGVQHYIGTFWNILDEPGAHFAHAFYSELIRGGSVGKSMRVARNDVAKRYGEESIVWASYLLYGDPCFSYFPTKRAESRATVETPQEEIGRESLALTERDPEEHFLQTSPPPATSLPALAKRSGKYILPILLLLVAVFLTPFIKDRITPSESDTSTMGLPPLIVILPFENISGNSEDDEFAFGLTQDLINGLYHIKGIRVVPLMEVRRFKGGDFEFEKIKAQFQCQYIFHGTVQRSSDRARIFVELVSAETGRQVWSKPYDSKLTMQDIFAFRDDLTEKILPIMEVKITAEEIERVTKRPTDSLSAYDLVLLGQKKHRIHTKDTNQEAIALLEKALEIDSSYAAAYVGLGACYLDRYHRGFELDIHSIDRAIEYCNKALEIDPEQAEGYHVLAMAYRLKYAYETAVDYDHRAIEIRPGYIRAYFTLGLAYIYLCQYKNAHELFQKCLDLYDQYHEAWRGIGRIYFDQEQYKKANQYFEKAYKIRSKDLGTRLYLGWVNIEMGNDADGIAIFEEEIDRSPDSFWAYDFLARYYVVRRHFEQAKPYYEKIILELAPNSTSALNNAGLFYSMSGDYERSRELINRAIEIAPDNPYAHIQLCSSYYQSGDLEQALDLSRNLAARFSNKLEVLLEHGQLLLATGQIHKALKLSRDMASRFSEDPLALDFHGRALLRLGDLDEVNNLSLRMIKKFEESPRGYNLLAATLVRQNRVKEAFEIQKKGIEQAPTDPETLWCGIQVAKSAGHPQKTEEWSNRFAEMGLAPHIETAPIGQRWDNIFWLNPGMGLYPDTPPTEH